MFLLFIGGIETSSAKILAAIAGSPGATSLWASSSLWIALAAALVGFIATNRVVVGGFSFQASRESVMAGFVSALYIFFASDMYSIISKVAETTCPVGGAIRACGWEYWVIWAMVLPLLVGFAISLVQFVGGSD